MLEVSYSYDDRGRLWQISEALLGDFGYSYENGNAVSDRIGGALLPTLILAGLSAALWLSIAVVLGVVTALRNGGLFDNAFSVFTYVTAAFPTFILGFALISIFSAFMAGVQTTKLGMPVGAR